MSKEQFGGKKDILKTAAMVGLMGVAGGVAGQGHQQENTKLDTSKTTINYEKPDTSGSTINPFEGGGDDPSIPSIEAGTKMLQENSDLLNAYLNNLGTYIVAHPIDEKSWHENRSSDLGVGSKFGPQHMKDTTYNKPINKYQRYIRWSGRPDAPMLLIDIRIVPKSVIGYAGDLPGKFKGRPDVETMSEYVEVPKY